MKFLKSIHRMSYIFSGVCIAENQILYAVFFICLALYLEKMTWGIFGN